MKFRPFSSQSRELCRYFGWFNAEAACASRQIVRALMVLGQIVGKEF